MSDIVVELRERALRAEQEGDPIAELDDAADEIERLRFTDEERKALNAILSALRVEKGCGFRRYDGQQHSTDYAEEYTALRGLLERLGGGK